MEDKPKRKRDQQPAWWQFPHRFSYRIESDYETVIHILEGLEYQTQGWRIDAVLYSDDKGHETAFELDYRVHGKYGDWDVQNRIVGRIREQNQAVILEGILIEATEQRNAILGLFVLIGVLFIGLPVAIGLPILGIITTTIVSVIIIITSRSNRADLFNHMSDGLYAAKVPVYVLSNPAMLEFTEPSLLNENQESQFSKSKSAL